MTENLATQIDTLRGLVSQLSDSQQAFATSLIDQFGRRGLSDKQAHWVGVLIQRAQGGDSRPQTQVGNVKGIVELLERAKQHLRFPAVLVRAGDRDLRLSIAGAQARVPGAINVTSSERDPVTGRNDWFGRISRDGVFEASPKFDGETQTAVALALTALANDPAKAAADYGRLTGYCCFCRLPLSDERSTEVGYGPICAKHFGLPWGEAKPKLRLVKSKKSLVEIAQAMAS